ncbi:hypothetical protein AAY473_006930 [Plecturocebus cupreus]
MMQVPSYPMSPEEEPMLARLTDEFPEVWAETNLPGLAVNHAPIVESKPGAILRYMETHRMTSEPWHSHTMPITLEHSASTIVEANKKTSYARNI